MERCTSLFHTTSTVSSAELRGGQGTFPACTCYGRAAEAELVHGPYKGDSMILYCPFCILFAYYYLSI